MHKILLIEDDPRIARVIHQILPMESFYISDARTLEEAYHYLAYHRPDLVLLDRKLPDGDGVDIAEYVHLSEATFPILVISGKGMIEDRIFGLEKGADDYLVKPFSTTELVLRIKKLLGRTKVKNPHILQAGYVSIYPERGVVQLRDKEVHLRKKELEILAYLIRHKNSVISRDKIISNVWGENNIPDLATIDVYIRRIRALLGNKEKIIQTVRGFGYIVKD